MERRYSIREMAEMVFCYGLANGNGRKAREIYAEKYPKRQIPSYSMFSRLFARLMENGSFARRTIDCGNSSRSLRPEVEERVLRRVADNPDISVRKLAAAEGISRSQAWIIRRQ